MIDILIFGTPRFFKLKNFLLRITTVGLIKFIHLFLKRETATRLLNLLIKNLKDENHRFAPANSSKNIHLSLEKSDSSENLMTDHFVACQGPVQYKYCSKVLKSLFPSSHHHENFLNHKTERDDVCESEATNRFTIHHKFWHSKNYLSFNSTSCICVFRSEVSDVGVGGYSTCSLPGRCIRNIQGNQYKNTILTCNAFFFSHTIPKTERANK